MEFGRTAAVGGALQNGASTFQSDTLLIWGQARPGPTPHPMRISEHLRTTGGALKRWFLAQTLDAIAVGAIWFFGLLIIGVPGALLWAILAAALQFVPQVGLVLSLIGPAIAAVASGGLERMIYVLILYAIIAIVDGMALQPFLMKRTARVPIWASILAPVVLGMLFNVWGVLLSAPLLAIIYAYRARAAARNASQS